MLPRRPHENPPAHHVPGVVVQENHHLRLPSPSQSGDEKVRLPQLPGPAPLKTTHLVLVPLALRLLRREPLLVQRPPHRLPAHPQMEEAPQPIPDPTNPRVRIPPLLLQDPLPNQLRGLRLLLPSSAKPPLAGPAMQGPLMNAQLPGNLGLSDSLLQRFPGFPADFFRVSLVSLPAPLIYPSDIFCHLPSPPLGGGCILLSSYLP